MIINNRKGYDTPEHNQDGSSSDSEYRASGSILQGPTPHVVLAAEATTYSTSSTTKSESSFEATTYIGVSTKVLNKFDPIHGGE